MQQQQTSKFFCYFNMEEALKDFFHLLPNFFCIFDMFFWLLANPITFSLLIYFIEGTIINILLLTFDFLLLQIPIQ